MYIYIYIFFKAISSKGGHKSWSESSSLSDTSFSPACGKQGYVTLN